MLQDPRDYPCTRVSMSTGKIFRRGNAMLKDMLYPLFSFKSRYIWLNCSLDIVLVDIPTVMYRSVGFPTFLLVESFQTFEPLPIQLLQNFISHF